MIKKLKKPIWLFALTIVFNFIFVSCNYAANAEPKLEKLSEYNFFDLQPYETEKDSDADDFYFQGKKHLIFSKLVGNSKLQFTTKVFDAEFKSFKNFSSSVNFTSPFKKIEDVYINVDANSTVAFLEVEFSDGEDNYNSIHFKSTDGINWQPYVIIDHKNLELNNIQYINDALITASFTDTSNNYNRFRNMYSKDNGETWQDLNPLGSYNTPSINSGVDNKLFAHAYNEDFYLIDTNAKDEESRTTKINVPATTKILHDGIEHELNIFTLEDVVKVGDDLFSRSWYHTPFNAYENTTIFLDEEKYLTSKDGGFNWELINLDFPKQEVHSFYKKGDSYYVVTTTATNDEEDDEDESSDDDQFKTKAKIEKEAISKLQDSKTYFYKLTKEQFLSNNKSNLVPVKVLDNSAPIETVSYNDETVELVYLENQSSKNIKAGFFQFN